MINYIIPARKGSKGFPGKNRLLLKYTLGPLPKLIKIKTIVTTDDTDLTYPGIKFLIRDSDLSHDFTSMKSVLIDVVEKYKIPDSDTIIMLYLTYPGRTINEIKKCFDFFKSNNAKSLLCKKEVKSNPFLCMFKNGDKGQQIINHNLYRRQDYPEVFEISHYIFISKVSELKNLNYNLYNEDTIFYPIGDTVDVDTEEDFEQFKKMSIHDTE